MSTIIVCPRCHKENHYEKLGREAGSLCWSCHYPLFWAPELQARSADTLQLGVGSGGSTQTMVALVQCRRCGLMNEPSAVVCLRCDTELHPKPVVITPPAPPPPPILAPAPPPAPPEPVPAPRSYLWLWVTLAVLVVVGVILLILLL